jgi:hypothetical protein
MKNIKTLAIGLIIGIMLGMGVFAVEYVINPNPYPIVVNGQQQDIQALNIDGFTYMKLADAAKVLNTSVKFNEATEQIEINTISTSTEGVSLMSTTAAIEYDTTTGLPVGAEIIEYKRWKNAVRYNDNIYLSNSTLAGAGIFVRADVKANTITIEKDGDTTRIDIPTTPENIFLNRADRAYCNVKLFGL